MFFDIFGGSYQFNLKSKTKKQKTGVGAFVSFIIIVIGLVYFFYVCYEYFSGNLSPRVTQQYSQPKLNRYTFKKSPIQTALNIPVKYQNENFNPFQYFTVMGTICSDPTCGHTIENPVDPTKIKQIKFIDCPKDNHSIKQKTCIDVSQDDITVEAHSDGKKLAIYLFIMKCIPVNPQVPCKSDPEINEFLENSEFIIKQIFPTEQYDIQKKKLQQSYHVKEFMGDYNNIEMVEIYYTKTETQIDDNILITTHKEKVESLSSYRIEQTTLSQSFALKKFYNPLIPTKGFLGVFKINIDLQQVVVNVEFVKISEVLAIFLGIFNSILGIGIIGKIASEYVMEEEIYSTQLISKYKQTAEDLKQMQQKEKNMCSKYKVLGCEDLNLLRSKSSIKTLIKGIFDSNQKDNKISNTPELNKENVYQIIKSQCENSISVSDMLDEIQTLRLALQIIFTKEQYSVLKFCGKRIPDFLKDADIKNHLEQLEEIDLNEQLQKQYLQQFINNYKESKNNVAADIDEQSQSVNDRLFHCLLKQISHKFKESDILESIDNIKFKVGENSEDQKKNNYNSQSNNTSTDGKNNKKDDDSETKRSQLVLL